MSTYREALDAVMVKLRESTVQTLSDDYVQLIGAWMNTIKEGIEDSWDWQAGRREVSFDSVAGQRTYDLSSDLPRRSRLVKEQLRHDKVPLLFDVTIPSQGFRLIEIPDLSRRTANLHDSTETSATPMFFSVYSSADGLQLAFRELPAQVRSYTGVFYVPDAELTSLDDEFHIPFRSLVLGTLWLAAQERGEELGLDSNTLATMFADRLAKDIALEMGEYDTLAVPV